MAYVFLLRELIYITYGIEKGHYLIIIMIYHILIIIRDMTLIEDGKLIFGRKASMPAKSPPGSARVLLPPSFLAWRLRAACRSELKVSGLAPASLPRGPGRESRVAQEAHGKSPSPPTPFSFPE